MLIVKKDEGYFKKEYSLQPKVINEIVKDDVLDLAKAIYEFGINNKGKDISTYIDNNFDKIKNPVNKTIYKVTCELLKNIFDNATNIKDDIDKSLIKLKDSN